MGCSLGKIPTDEPNTRTSAVASTNRGSGTHQDGQDRSPVEQPAPTSALTGEQRHVEAAGSAQRQDNGNAKNPKYRLTKQIEKGCNSRIFEAYNRVTSATSERVAITFLARGDYCKDLRAQITNHVMLTIDAPVHPHIIEAKEVYLTPRFLAVVLEYAPGGDLFKYVNARGRLDDGTARHIFQQLVIALDHCHKKHVIVRDQTPDNTLIRMKDGRPCVKLCDFG
ncbi:hypothetical protein WJX84_008407 [Apatococcus fuscideae]